MDKRFKQINRLLSEYSRGNFDKKLSLSEKLDGIDAISAGINMLGEELQAVTISKNYFSNIFNAVSDMVFVLDYKGNILDINRSASVQLGYDKEDIQGKPVSFLQAKEKTFNKKFLQTVKRDNKNIETETNFLTLSKKQIPVHTILTVLRDEAKKGIQILLTAKDISSRIQQENAVIRAIVDTQESERGRLAKDLHDSLGQRMSAIKFYISSMAKSIENEEQKSNLLISNQALLQMIAEMRNICFNLQPATLADFGLITTVRELCHQPEYKGRIHFKIEADPLFPVLPKEMEMDIFRVIQEFFTNATVHGAASAFPSLPVF